jgi:hypothetical protein
MTSRHVPRAASLMKSARTWCQPEAGPLKWCSCFLSSSGSQCESRANMAATTATNQCTMGRTDSDWVCLCNTAWSRCTNALFFSSSALLPVTSDDMMKQIEPRTTNSGLELGVGLSGTRCTCCAAGGNRRRVDDRSGCKRGRHTHGCQCRHLAGCLCAHVKCSD